MRIRRVPQLKSCGGDDLDYPGQNVLNGTSKSKLSLHPTVKPVALVADAIRDCSNRNGVILTSGGVTAEIDLALAANAASPIAT